MTDDVEMLKGVASILVVGLPISLLLVFGHLLEPLVGAERKAKLVATESSKDAVDEFARLPLSIISFAFCVREWGNGYWEEAPWYSVLSGSSRFVFVWEMWTKDSPLLHTPFRVCPIPTEIILPILFLLEVGFVVVPDTGTVTWVIGALISVPGIFVALQPETKLAVVISWWWLASLILRLKFGISLEVLVFFSVPDLMLPTILLVSYRARATAEEELAERMKRHATQLANAFRLSFPGHDRISSYALRNINAELAKLTSERRARIESKRLNFGDFIINKKISSGGFGAVYVGWLETRAIPVAIKSISGSEVSKAGVHALVTEILTLSALRHEHIVATLGFCFEPHVCILLEFMPKGNLQDLLAMDDDAVTWRSPLLAIAAHVASALAYLESIRVTHADVKPENILMDDSGGCKLADFGLARFNKINDKLYGLVVGTKRFMAPEVVRGEKIGPCSDVWSFGVTLWEMSTRREFPSPLDEEIEPGRRALWDCVLTSPDLPTPAVIVRLVRECLVLDSAARPSTAVVLSRLSTIRRDVEEAGIKVFEQQVTPNEPWVKASMPPKLTRSIRNESCSPQSRSQKHLRQGSCSLRDNSASPRFAPRSTSPRYATRLRPRTLAIPTVYEREVKVDSPSCRLRISQKARAAMISRLISADSEIAS